MSETQAAARWFYETLTSDPELDELITGVFEGVAPADQTYPFVTFQHMGGSDIRVVGPQRYASTSLWLLKAVTDGTSFTPLVAVERRVDLLIQAASGSNTHGTVFVANREQPFRLNDTQDRTRQMGGMYRLLTRRAA